LPFWTSVFPIRAQIVSSDLVTAFRSPIEFGGALKLKARPEWVLHDPLVNQLMLDQLQIVKDSQFAFVVEYEADSVEGPDSEWTGSEERSIQESKSLLALRANLALWLALPSPTGTHMGIHGQQGKDGWMTRTIDLHEPLKAHPSYALAAVMQSAAQQAGEIHQQMANLPPNSTVQIATDVTWAALTHQLPYVRYALFWTALEALFGLATDGEPAFKLAQRIALFLESDGLSVQETYELAKESYAFRSDAVQGRSWNKMKKPKGLDEDAVTLATETLIRRVLLRILQSPEAVQNFDAANLS